MNKRIIELAEQAGFTANDEQKVFLRVYEQELKKFGELVVEECMKQGGVLVKHYIDTHTEQEQTLLLASIADYTNEIKKHFGVEE